MRCTMYHVMSCGNERRVIVRDDVDRRRRLDGLRRTVETYGWWLHAFVLMNNHDPLFVETPEAHLSTGMQHFDDSYSGYFNRRHCREWAIRSKAGSRGTSSKTRGICLRSAATSTSIRSVPASSSGPTHGHGGMAPATFVRQRD